MFSHFVRTRGDKNQIFCTQVTEFRETFKENDVDGKGTITMATLLEIVAEEFDDRSPELFVMAAMADTNGDGVINFEEFLEMMVKG